MSDCLFCRIVSRQIPSQIVFEDDLALVFQDLNPQAPTHVLIIPKKHIPSLADAAEEDAALLGHLQRVAGRFAREHSLEKGFRVVTNSGRGAGQSVDHLHYHLLGGRAMTWPPG
ncbi:MAG: histidine triad nucleotide-binding protein [Elusimicrobia bacterium]|nr:histidine triad nucleotide-binding protein [Elusimicrobiota bacterium]